MTIIYLDDDFCFDSSERTLSLTRVNELNGRFYYATHPPYRAIVVSRIGPLEDVTRGVRVDASIGWDDGYPGFVIPGQEGKRHTKVTLRRIVDSDALTPTLSHILLNAPRSDRPGGARGLVGRKPTGSIDDPVEQHGITMPRSYWKRLLQHGNSWSAAIRNLLDDIE